MRQIYRDASARAPEEEEAKGLVAHIERRDGELAVIRVGG
jgi:hypothetical protein